MLCQQRLHDLRDNPMFDVIAIVGDRQRFQSGGFFTMAGFGMVPAGEQTVGGKPQSLKLFVGVADEMGWRKNAANPIANLLISATVGARIKQQVVASFLEAAFDRLFILRGAF